MRPEQLQAELQAWGLVVLGVGQHPRNPDILIVYLHGAAGQWAGGQARYAICGVPGVLGAIDSVPTPSIVLVRVAAVRERAAQPGGPPEATSAEGNGDISTASWQSLSGLHD